MVQLHGVVPDALPAPPGVHVAKPDTDVNARAVGLPLSTVMVFALAAPIFGMSALPVSVSGWGTREFATVAVFGLVGVESEFAAATAVLYGLCGALQGVIFSPLLLTKV